MLSLPKILLLALIVGAVIFGTRVLGRARKSGDDDRTPTRRSGSGNAVDLSKCRVCGSFVDPAAGACDRADCPYA